MALDDPSPLRIANTVRPLVNGLGSAVGIGRNRNNNPAPRNQRTVRQLRTSTAANRALAPTAQRSSAPVAVGTTSQSGFISDTVTMVGGRPGRHIRWVESLPPINNGLTGSGYDYYAYRYELNPTALPTEILLALAAQYQRFMFLDRTMLEVVPIVPTTMPGQMILAYVSDPNQTLPASFETLSKLWGAVTFPVWEGGIMKGGCTANNREPFFMRQGTSTSDIRLYMQGYFIIAFQGVPTSGTPSVPVGSKIASLKLHYDVVLSEPDPTPTPTFSFSTSQLVASGSTWVAPEQSLMPIGWQRISDTTFKYVGPSRKFRTTAEVIFAGDFDATTYLASATTAVVLSGSLTASYTNTSYSNTNVVYAVSELVVRYGDTFTWTPSGPAPADISINFSGVEFS